MDPRQEVCASSWPVSMVAAANIELARMLADLRTARQIAHDPREVSGTLGAPRVGVKV
jgi:hypothetical protein